MVLQGVHGVEFLLLQGILSYVDVVLRRLPILELGTVFQVVLAVCYYLFSVQQEGSHLAEVECQLEGVVGVVDCDAVRCQLIRNQLGEASLR